MGKILSTKEYEALKSKADNYDTVVSGVVSKHDGMTAEEVNPEFIQGAIDNQSDPDTASAGRITELEGQVSTLTTERDNLKSEVNTLKSENETLTSENEQLRELPGSESVSGKKGEVETSSEGKDNLLEYAQSGKSTAEIAAKAVECGFYNPKRLK